MKVTGKRAVLAVSAALEEAGLGRMSGFSGGETTGWIAPNHYGSTGFSVKKLPDGDVAWHVVLSGKPHLRYRKWVERERDGTIDMHEPVNPESIAPRIRAAFETLGLDVRSVRFSGSQGHWDDDVDYEVTTDYPAWLEQPDRNNVLKDGDATILRAMALSDRAIDLMPPPEGTLVGYVQAGKAYLTRESVTALCDKAAAREAARQEDMARYGGEGSPNLPRYLKAKIAQVTLSEAGEFTLAPPGAPASRISPEILTNHWGDEVEVWRVPSNWVRPQSRFKPSVPFMLDGEMRDAVPFRVVDAQHGGDAPWLAEDAPAPGPR